MSEILKVDNQASKNKFTNNFDLQETESKFWKGKQIKNLKGSSHPWLAKIILCSHKKSKKNHGKIAASFSWIAGGIAIACLPIPGTLSLGIGMAMKGGFDASKDIMQKQAEKDIQVKLKVGAKF